MLHGVEALLDFADFAIGEDVGSALRLDPTLGLSRDEAFLAIIVWKAFFGGTESGAAAGRILKAKGTSSSLSDSSPLGWDLLGDLELDWGLIFLEDTALRVV